MAGLVGPDTSLPPTGEPVSGHIPTSAASRRRDGTLGVRPRLPDLAVQAARDVRSSKVDPRPSRQAIWFSAAKARARSRPHQVRERVERREVVEPVAQRAAPGQLVVGLAQRGGGRQQTRQGRDDQIEAELAELGRGQQRGAAGLDHVGHQRDRRQGLGDPSQLVDRLGGLHEHRVHPQVGGRPSPLQGLVQAERAPGRRCGRSGGGVGDRRARRAAWPASRRAAPPPCRPCARSAWARPGPRRTSRPRRRTPTARRCEPCSGRRRSRCRRPPPPRCRAPPRTPVGPRRPSRSG